MIRSLIRPDRDYEASYREYVEELGDEGYPAEIVQRFVVRTPNNGVNTNAGKAGAG